MNREVTVFNPCPVRIAGGALLVAAELVVPSKVDLFLAAYVLQPAGLGILMLATIGFLGLAYVTLCIFISLSDHLRPAARAATAKIPGCPRSSECSVSLRL